MKLKKLIEMQSSGAFNVDKGDFPDKTVHIGKDKLILTDEQCRVLLEKLGWDKYNKKPADILSETGKFINGIKGGIANNVILEQTDVYFRNIRKTNTTSYIYRIKMICKGKFDITILKGMQGMGGVYGVLSAVDNFQVPVFACKTKKQLGEYINSLVKDKENK